MNNRMNESLGFILHAEEKHTQKHVSVEMNYNKETGRSGRKEDSLA